MSILNIPKKILNAVTPASTGEWAKLIEGRAHPLDDGIFNAGKEWIFQLDITPGDTVRLEFSNDIYIDTAGTIQLVASPVKTLTIEYNSTYTGDAISGTWAFVRVVKTGANGPATVLISL